MEINQIIEKFNQGSIRALGRAITIVENREKDSDFLLHELNKNTGKAHVIGFTGSPGAGKSSLIDSLVAYLRQNNIKVGIIAVDPSSPFTGGAILGDRIRMIQHSTDKGVFIRSMANRGRTGGLGIATRDAVKVLDAFGFDVIIIETVGAGQTEIDIVKTADTISVVLNPEAGDDIQAFKAGIMEIADIFVINKADLPGAGRTRISIETSVHESKAKDDNWMTPVIMTSSFKNQGFDELWSKLKSHYDHLKQSGEIENRRFKNMNSEIIAILENKLKNYLELKLKEEDSLSIIKKAGNKEITSRMAADEIFKRL